MGSLPGDRVTNVEHLAQLSGDAREVGTELCRRWPDTVITDSRRSPQTQALRMAKNCAVNRFWILGKPDSGQKPVYKWSVGVQRCHDWSVRHQAAPMQDIAAAFVMILNGLPLDELARISKHLAPVTAGARALDIRAVHDDTRAARLAYLHGEAAARGGTFLETEGGLEIWHWQAR